MSETPSSSGTSNDGPEHLADFVPEPEPGEEGAPPPAIAGVTPEGFVTADVFFDGFKAAHTIPGHMVGLQTLVHAPDMAEARQASDAIYEICCETPALHWLVKPGLKWLQRLAAIAAYALPLGVGIVAEVRARRAPASSPEAPPAAEPEREEPPADGAALS